MKSLSFNKGFIYIHRGGVGFTAEHTARIIEAFIGEYASGKSELAINRALELKSQGRKVTLVDLDTVEPFYTLRPLKSKLEGIGIQVIGFSQADSFGLGETGAMLDPRARWALMNEGDILLDIGYGVYGAQALNLVEGVDQTPELKVMAVVNQSRPMTSSSRDILDYLLSLGRVDGIISNTHLGDETTVEVIEQGNNIIMEVAAAIDVPVYYVAIDKKLQTEGLENKFPVPVKYIDRFMPDAIW